MPKDNKEILSFSLESDKEHEVADRDTLFALFNKLKVAVEHNTDYVCESHISEDDLYIEATFRISKDDKARPIHRITPLPLSKDIKSFPISQAINQLNTIEKAIAILPNKEYADEKYILQYIHSSLFTILNDPTLPKASIGNLTEILKWDLAAVLRDFKDKYGTPPQQTNNPSVLINIDEARWDTLVSILAITDDLYSIIDEVNLAATFQSLLQHDKVTDTTPPPPSKPPSPGKSPGKKGK